MVVGKTNCIFPPDVVLVAMYNCISVKNVCFQRQTFLAFCRESENSTARRIFQSTSAVGVQWFRLGVLCKLIATEDVL